MRTRRSSHRLTRPTGRANRRGASLVELMVAVVVLGIIGTASTRLLISQTRYYDVALKQREARTVSRAAVNLVLSDIRMVESTAGVEAATAASVTLRVPYVMGMFCGADGSTSVIALMPADSTVLANALPSGHAWRDGSGEYTYTNSALTTSAGGSTATATCTSEGITTYPGGSIITVFPALPTDAKPGHTVFLYQRVRYDFANSTVLPGRQALWRTLVDSDTREELAGPFESSARFRFFQFDRDTSDLSANVSDIRGLELVLNAESRFARAGRSSKEQSPFRTSVFFNNRVN